jgi:hypothetical protein
MNASVGIVDGHTLIGKMLAAPLFVSVPQKVTELPPCVEYNYEGEFNERL